MEYVAIACRCLLVVVFCASAASKLRGRGGFAAFVASVRALGLPGPWAGPAAVVVIAVEAATATLLLPPATVPAGLALAFALVVTFGGVILHAMRQGTRAPCRCFGRSEAPLGARHLARNGLLAAAAVTGAAAALTGPAAGPHPGGAAVAVAAGVVAACLVVVLDDLVELFGPRPTVVSSRAD